MIFTYAPKEREQLSAIESDFETVLESLAALRDIKDKHDINNQQFKDAKADAIKKISAIDQHFTELIEELDNARFNKLKTPNAILEDAKQQTNDAIIYAYVRIDTDLLQSDRVAENKVIADLSNSGLFSSISRWDFSKAFKDQKKAKFNPDKSPFLLDEIGLITFIKRSVLNKHLEALKGLPEAEQLENFIFKTVAASPYTTNPAAAGAKMELINPNDALFKPYMVMYHGKPTDQLAQLNKKDAQIDTITGRAKITSGEITTVFNDYQLIKGKSFINEHKLLITAISRFTDQNNYSKSGKQATNYRVAIPLDDYLIACGRDIKERETRTPEEAAKEKKRVVNAKKEERKKIRNSLEILSSQSLEWNEGTKGSADKNFAVTSMISGYSIKNGHILITISPDFGDCLVKFPQTQYPTALLSIDARNSNAYSMGLSLSNHYNNDNNQIIGTANRLKVETLLKYTDLPNITTVQKQRKSWEERIKEPFENALDVLTRQGVLEDWEYTKAKGVELTDAEAMQIADYETFKNLYITFELKDAPDHTARLARRAKEKEENQKRKKATKKK